MAAEKENSFFPDYAFTAGDEQEPIDCASISQSHE
jgi:hypothetical protein